MLHEGAARRSQRLRRQQPLRRRHAPCSRSCRRPVECLTMHERSSARLRRPRRSPALGGELLRRTSPPSRFRRVSMRSSACRWSRCRRCRCRACTAATIRSLRIERRKVVVLQQRNQGRSAISNDTERSGGRIGRPSRCQEAPAAARGCAASEDSEPRPPIVKGPPFSIRNSVTRDMPAASAVATALMRNCLRRGRARTPNPLPGGEEQDSFCRARASCYPECLSASLVNASA